MALPNIEAGEIDFTPFSVVGTTAIWRKEDTTLPPLYRPTIKLVVKPNSTGTNVNMTLKSVTPIVSTVNGVTVSTNSRVLTVSYTALQNVVDSSNGADIDAMIAALTALKQSLVQGRLP